MSRWFFLIDFVFLSSLAYYLMTNLQWYNYSLMRTLTKHHKWKWHFLYFIFPTLIYCLCGILGFAQVFYVFFALYLPFFIFWIYKLDRPLKWTGRVWRFFIILAVFFGLAFLLQIFYGNFFYSLICTLVFAVLVSNLFEMFLFNRYKRIAREKISSMTQLKIILITASYGKTSIKNYLAQILGARYFVHSTPRSVNTLKGIVVDINTKLDQRSDFYIVEAGARERGDIAEIAQFLNPEFVIIGRIGPQHLEYFGSLENIIQTKFEALTSNRLRFALIESKNSIPDFIISEKLRGNLKLSASLRGIKASLMGTKFEVFLDGEWLEFESSVLGSFNAFNIALCIEMAKQIGMRTDEIYNRVKKLQSIEHRLNKTEVGGKLILDDSFNGNLEGMKEAIKLSSEHKGRKVIVTPGVIESTEEINIELAQEIDKVFDLVIITGELNSRILSKTIVKAQKILLKDKASMETTLKACLKNGDLVLFANDAPNYI